MDEQLKTRLIGAVVLVVIAVLLIPELLSGRKAETVLPADGAAERGTRTYTIDLGGRALPATASGDVTPQPVARPAPPPPALPVPSGPPQPAVSAPAKEAPATTEPAPKAAPPAAVQTAPPPVNPPATPAKGGWTVQVGAFGTAATARKMASDLNSAGFKAYVSPLSRGGKTLYRVRVGHAADRPDADQLAAKLKGRGLPATVVANE
jgi:DedD protein